MSRIPPLPQEKWDTEATMALATKPDRPMPPSNMVGLLAHHPALAKAFLGYSKHLLSTSTLSRRTRELAILRIAWRRRCAYEWGQHLLMARKAGVSDAEIDQVRAGAPTLINRAVDELDADGTLADETYAELAAGFDDRQLLDFVFTVGTYGVLAMVLNTFRVELDPGLPVENIDI